MLKKVFFEITNECNLACSFCHGTRRPVRYVTEKEFRLVSKKMSGEAEYMYYHLMGEPLLHPDLVRFTEIARADGFKSVITTNGTLLSIRGDELLGAAGLFKVSVSLHSFEANSPFADIGGYLDTCFDFCAEAARAGKVAVMRLWNLGGENERNGEVLDRMHRRFAGKWEERASGYKIAPRLFLEWGERFEWPDPEAEYCGDTNACYGLRNQIGILSNGTVVPCCLDADGAVPLGNIFDVGVTARDILSSARAVAIRDGFRNRKVTENLCQRCGYAKVKKF